MKNVIVKFSGDPNTVMCQCFPGVMKVLCTSCALLIREGISYPTSRPRYVYKLHESGFIGVVYYNMEKMLSYWSMDQYNNVLKCTERKEGAMLPNSSLDYSI